MKFILPLRELLSSPPSENRENRGQTERFPVFTGFSFGDAFWPCHLCFEARARRESGPKTGKRSVCPRVFHTSENRVLPDPYQLPPDRPDPQPDRRFTSEIAKPSRHHS